MLPGEHLDGMECHEAGDHLGVSVARKGKGAGVWCRAAQMLGLGRGGRMHREGAVCEVRAKPEA